MVDKNIGASLVVVIHIFAVTFPITIDFENLTLLIPCCTNRCLEPKVAELEFLEIWNFIVSHLN